MVKAALLLLFVIVHVSVILSPLVLSTGWRSRVILIIGVVYLLSGYFWAEYQLGSCNAGCKGEGLAVHWFVLSGFVFISALCGRVVGIGLQRRFDFRRWQTVFFEVLVLTLVFFVFFSLMQSRVLPLCGLCLSE